MDYALNLDPCCFPPIRIVKPPVNLVGFPTVWRRRSNFQTRYVGNSKQQSQRTRRTTLWNWFRLLLSLKLWKTQLHRGNFWCIPKDSKRWALPFGNQTWMWRLHHHLQNFDPLKPVFHLVLLQVNEFLYEAQQASFQRPAWVWGNRFLLVLVWTKLQVFGNSTRTNKLTRVAWIIQKINQKPPKTVFVCWMSCCCFFMFRISGAQSGAADDWEDCTVFGAQKMVRRKDCDSCRFFFFFVWNNWTYFPTAMITSLNTGNQKGKSNPVDILNSFEAKKHWSGPPHRCFSLLMAQLVAGHVL